MSERERQVRVQERETGESERQVKERVRPVREKETGENERKVRKRQVRERQVRERQVLTVAPVVSDGPL